MVVWEIRPDQRVREGDLAVAAGVATPRHHICQVLEVDLVDDARSGRHDAQVAEGGLSPAEQPISLAVALVLARDVEGEGVGCAVAIDLDGVVDEPGRRVLAVDARWVPPSSAMAFRIGRQVTTAGTP